MQVVDHHVGNWQAFRHRQHKAVGSEAPSHRHAAVFTHRVYACEQVDIHLIGGGGIVAQAAGADIVALACARLAVVKGEMSLLGHLFFPIRLGIVGINGAGNDVVINYVILRLLPHCGVGCGGDSHGGKRMDVVQHRFLHGLSSQSDSAWFGPVIARDYQACRMLPCGWRLVGDPDPCTLRLVHVGGGDAADFQGEHPFVYAWKGKLGIGLDVFAAHLQRHGVVVVDHGLTKLHGHVLHRSDQHRVALGRPAGDEGFPALVAPEVFGQLGIVDEGVAVALHLVDLLVAVKLFLADGILFVPFQQQIDSPGVEGRVKVVAHHPGVLPGKVLVAGDHIEVCAGEVTLVDIGRLEDQTSTAPLPWDRRADGGYSVFKRGLARNLPEGIVWLGYVGGGLRGIEMVEVDVGRGRGGASPPALRQGMLSVKPAERVGIQRDVGIHVPPLAVPLVSWGIDIGLAEIIRQVVVRRNQRVIVKQVVEGSFQLPVTLAADRWIITGGNLGRHSQNPREEARQPQQPLIVETSFFHYVNSTNEVE